MVAKLFTNVRIFDGSGGKLFPGDVLVEGNRIKAVAKGNGGIAADGAEVIDGGGATLMPGLVEAHGPAPSAHAFLDLGRPVGLRVAEGCSVVSQIAALHWAIRYQVHFLTLGRGLSTHCPPPARRAKCEKVNLVPYSLPVLPRRTVGGIPVPTTRALLRGLELGLPTANLEPTEQLLPADGIYSGTAESPQGRIYPAAISVGTKPTFGENARVCEAHLLGGGNELDGYGWSIRLKFRNWLRDQIAYGRVSIHC